MKKTIQQPTLLHSKRFLSTISLSLLGGVLFAQTAQISGKIVDENKKPIDKAEIIVADKSYFTNEDGDFKINIPSNQSVTVTFNYNNYLSYAQTVSLRDKNKKQLFIQLVPDKNKAIELDEAIITFQSNSNKPLQSTSLSAAQMQQGPSLTGGVTDLLKTLPFVNSNTELSSQYMVRGGNYDENLIYVNGMEVYKPQLIRSGQQEGLSFVNPNMTEFINFSAGGWEAKYGDKMSSVLDVTYKRPQKLEGQLEASLMGGSATIGGASKNKKLSAIIGARYQNRNLVLNTLKGDTNFNPQYYDVQTNINYKLNDKWNIAFLGTVSRSRYEMFPIKRDTYINRSDNPLLLTVYYNGKEDDKYGTETGNLSFTYQPNSKVDLALDVFAYHSKEQEYFDIQGSYFISEVDEKGNATSTTDVGTQLDHARNNFDALVAGIQHKGKYKINRNNNIEWGLKYQQEDIRDLWNEWQVIDSAGYVVTPTPSNGLDLQYYVNSKNNIKTNRISGYAQYTGKYMWNDTKVFFNAGLRTTYWDFNNETDISPRAQIAVKPDWKSDMLFRFSTGIYYQPPFYREIRRLDGSLNDKVKSQKSIHFIAGNDYEFKWMDRPFKLTTELYYKILQDLNPYYVDNVRIRYTADNNSKGYAYGLDMRLYGQFVPGIDSWFSASYARAYQNIDNRGNIPLPTDPRFKFSAFFQDYMDFLPSFKVNVNMVYASGLPNGAPQFSDPYDYQTTLSAYKRVDIGFVKELVNQKELKPSKGTFWSNFKEVSIGVDVFNIFDIKNQISNSWIRDVNSPAVYTMPNYLTGRFFNAKINFKF
ncbi:carboxypeptidase-like regulatory domain-containing protein [Chishuiella sp.]|uniref:TonB-dependent receptor n=1 Tax=Chishuiella sp. TaxID=1969467 RepID=UPI0028A7376C|nr:carboxypeptidase-like regulatory domain-containing protein [Chishuiella sp.]